METPLKILSLLPSATEIVGALGLSEQLVGITHECDVCPDAAGMASVLARGVERVTVSHIDPHKLEQEEIDRAVSASLSSDVALYALKKDAVARAQPSLVLTQALCAVCAPDARDVEAVCRELSAFWPDHPAVVNLEPTTLLEVGHTFRTVADACGVAEVGVKLEQRFLAGFDQLRNIVAGHQTETPNLFMFEWLDPPFDGGHWVPDQLAAAGVRCLSNESGGKSARRAFDDIIALDPDVITIACCGFDAERNKRDAEVLLDPNNHSETAQAFRSLRAVQTGRAFALDGNRYFARPAPSLLTGAALLAACAHRKNAALAAALQESGLLDGNLLPIPLPRPAD